MRYYEARSTDMSKELRLTVDFRAEYEALELTPGIVSGSLRLAGRDLAISETKTGSSFQQSP